MPQKIFLTTEDGVKIAGLYFKAEQPSGWIIFLHMMPATKESFSDLAEKLYQSGYSGLTIDFRGHGESEGGPDGYTAFQDKDHQKSILDVLAAANFLKGEGADKISVIGASIGANLALEFLAENNFAEKAVLLSPGLNYRGIIAKDSAIKIKAGKKIFILSSKDDDSNSAEAEKIYSFIPADVGKKKEILETGGHGTQIPENNPQTTEDIINFIQSQ